MLERTGLRNQRTTDNGLLTTDYETTDCGGHIDETGGPVGPPVRAILNFGLVRQSRTDWIVRVALHDHRMALMIAVQLLAAVINIRQPDRSTGAVARTAEHDRARGAAVVAHIRSGDSVEVLDAVASRDGIPEVEQVWICSTAG